MGIKPVHPIKIKVSGVQIDRPIFRGKQLTKGKSYTCSTHVTHGDNLEILSSATILLKVTPETEYLMKVNLEQLLFEYGTFSAPQGFKESYFLERTSLFGKPPFFKCLLPFITLVNGEGIYVVEVFLNNI